MIDKAAYQASQIAQEHDESVGTLVEKWWHYFEGYYRRLTDWNYDLQLLPLRSTKDQLQGRPPKSHL